MRSTIPSIPSFVTADVQAQQQDQRNIFQENNYPFYAPGQGSELRNNDNF